METTPQLTDFFAKVDALATPEEKISALKTAATTLSADTDGVKSSLAQLEAEHEALKDQHNSFVSEYTAEIERLSKELSFTANEAGKSLLSVEIGGVRYVTGAGRKYNLKGKEIKAEDLVKDIEACKALIAKKSGIFTIQADN